MFPLSQGFSPAPIPRLLANLVLHPALLRTKFSIVSVRHD